MVDNFLGGIHLGIEWRTPDKWSFAKANSYSGCRAK